MRRCRLWCDDEAQSLVEYTLLMAFLSLGAAAMFMGSGQGTAAVWDSANSQLTTATATVGASTPTAAGNSGGSPGDTHHDDDHYRH